MISGKSQIIGRVPTMEDVNTVVSGVEGRVDSLSEKVADLSNDVAEVDGSIDGLGSKLEFVKGAQDRLLEMMLYEMRLQKVLMAWLVALTVAFVVAVTLLATRPF